MTDWWKEFLSEDVDVTGFSKDWTELMTTYQPSIDQQRIFQSIKKGRNLYLSDDLTDEDIV